MNDRQLRNFVIGLGLGVSGFGLAAVSLPNTFTAGTPIKSAEVNANFNALKTALETASGINDGAVGVGKLHISGTAADGKVLKFSSGALSWGDDLTGGPGGTAYTAGAGLSLSAGNQFSVNFAGSGSATTAARSDHDHLGAVWSQTAEASTTREAGLKLTTSSSARIVGVALPGLYKAALEVEDTNGQGAGIISKGFRNTVEISPGCPTEGALCQAVGINVEVGGTSHATGIFVRNSGIDTGNAIHGILQNSQGAAVEGGFINDSPMGGAGILGRSNSPNAAGVEASGSGAGGVALRIEHGAIKVVSGADAPAFVYTVPTPNTSPTLCIDNPLTNNDPNAMLSITPVYNGAYFADPWAIFYAANESRWCIFNQKNGSGTGTAFPAGMKFNILVIKQ